MAHIAGRDATDTEPLSERDDSAIHQAQAKIRVPAIDGQGSRELAKIGWGIDERAAGKIRHERRHRPPFVAEKIVDLREHQAWDVPSPRLVEGTSESTMVGCARDEVVE